MCATFEDALVAPPPALSWVGADRWSAVSRQVRGGIESPLTTSAGRLLDAVAALCGIGGQGGTGSGIESAAGPIEAVRASGAYVPSLIEEGSAPIILDARPMIRSVVTDIDEGVPADTIAMRFLLGLADATADALLRIAARHRVAAVGLAGDTFAGPLLRRLTAEALERGGARVLLAQRLPAGDEGISFGQATIAARLERSRS
jgi:hydrogenase maturation protein HypF